jgi:hypothetical protein
MAGLFICDGEPPIFVFSFVNDRNKLKDEKSPHVKAEKCMVQ